MTAQINMIRNEDETVSRVMKVCVQMCESSKNKTYLLDQDWMYTHFDSYFYSRPVSYRSYYPRIQKPEILVENDPDTQEVMGFFRHNNIDVSNQGGLSRGILWNGMDLEVGKRTYNHRATTPPEYYIRQWKETNDLPKHHPTGTHFVTKSFPNFMKEINTIMLNSRKTYK